MSMDKSDKKDLVVVMRSFLLEKPAHTQAEICNALKRRGCKVNQTKVSRTLRKLGAVKVKNECGEVVYWLPKEPPPPELSVTVNELVSSVFANEAMVVIRTSPGAAQLIARLIDYRERDNDILGVIAGDDTVFIAPKSTSNIKKTLKKIRSLFGF